MQHEFTIKENFSPKNNLKLIMRPATGVKRRKIRIMNLPFQLHYSHGTKNWA